MTGGCLCVDSFGREATTELAANVLFLFKLRQVVFTMSTRQNSTELLANDG